MITRSPLRSSLLLLLLLVAPLVLVSPKRAQAFCGFYVAPSDAPLYADASMVALMRDGTRTVLSMSNNYKGRASEFAMVVPVPVVLHKEDVKTLPHDTFHHLETLSAPRLVEYWEQDPCVQPSENEEGMMGSPSPAATDKAAKDDDGDYGVKIEAKFEVGEYDVVVLSAEQSDGLETWLHDNKYNVPKGASSALAPYIKEQQKFFVAKVALDKVKRDEHGVAVLSPLRFAYESADFRLPVRLGLLNSAGKQDLIVFVLSKNDRYEVANYPNAFIPTNLDVVDGTRDAFAPFYASLFDVAMSKAGGRAVITEYAWESSSCDPCPTPPLNDADIALLGGDVLFGMPSPADPGKDQGDSVNGYYGSGTPMVLTRLHTRYDATTLSEDLVFRTAGSIVGGREHVIGADGALEKGAVSDSQNNFQARYAIRHVWTGAINCRKPRRGAWGGPPGGGVPTQPSAATGLAAASRDVKLASMIVSNAADIGVNADALPAGVVPPPPKPRFPWVRAIVAAAVVLALFGVAFFVSRRRPAA